MGAVTQFQLKMGLTQAKAYPVDVMGFHELINDVVGGTPITVCW